MPLKVSSARPHQRAANDKSATMNADTPPTLALIIPCYNEQAGLSHTLSRLSVELDRLIEAKQVSTASYMLFVDDGSTDRTWTLIEGASRAQTGRVHGLKLSRNVGHQNALLAGLLTQVGKADATISLDADLQDDISIIAKMIDHFRNGDAEIVFAVRKERSADGLLKRGTAGLYYRILNWLGADTIPHHADFRLMSDRTLRALSLFGEVHVFLRGLVLQLGFKTVIVEFDRQPRLHGKTKYTLGKMGGLALNGITSLSVRPIRLIALLGVILFSIFLGISVWVFATWLAGYAVQGWTSIMLPFLLIAAFQTCALAVIGEYVGKIYFEAKSRPRYIVEREIGELKKKD